MSDHPDELMSRFEQGARGEADIDMVEVLWAIIDDIRDSYRLAMASAGVYAETSGEIEATVTDYVINNYGEGA